MVRTVFIHPNPWHLYSQFLIRRTWLRSRCLTPAQRSRWADALWSAAYGLFVQDDARAVACLWTAFRYTGRLRPALLAMARGLGLSHGRLHRLRRSLTGQPGTT
jgi:hypothetical protein